ADGVRPGRADRPAETRGVRAISRRRVPDVPRYRQGHSASRTQPVRRANDHPRDAWRGARFDLGRIAHLTLDASAINGGEHAMSQALSKKPVWKSVSWASEIADPTGSDYDDLELESDDEFEEDDYYDPLDDYEEPTTRGKSGRSSWDMDTRAREGDRRPEARRQPSRQTGHDAKGTEDAQLKSEQRIQ